MDNSTLTAVEDEALEPGQDYSADSPIHDEYEESNDVNDDENPDLIPIRGRDYVNEEVLRELTKGLNGKPLPVTTPQKKMLKGKEGDDSDSLAAWQQTLNEEDMNKLLNNFDDLLHEYNDQVIKDEKKKE